MRAQARADADPFLRAICALNISRFQRNKETRGRPEESRNCGYQYSPSGGREEEREATRRQQSNASAIVGSPMRRQRYTTVKMEKSRSAARSLDLAAAPPDNREKLFKLFGDRCREGGRARSHGDTSLSPYPAPIGAGVRSPGCD